MNSLELPENVFIEFPDKRFITTFNIDLYVNETSSLWFDHQYNFTITFSENYPFDPPKVNCNSLVYHPNIDP